MELLKRPYDITLDLTVQDICVVDRFQSFGPEFELILCSDGKNLLNQSSSSSPVKKSSHSCPDFSQRSYHSNASTHSMTPIRAYHSDIPSSATSSRRCNDYIMFSPESDSPTLLVVTYKHITKYSTEHPAMKDIELTSSRDGEEGEREGEGGEGEVFILPGDDEPEIHKISVHCTGIDVMGMSL